MEKASKAIPGPPGLPGVGSFLNAARMLPDPVVGLLGLYRRYGPIASVARGATRMVAVFSPEYNRAVLSEVDSFYTADAGTMPMRPPKGSAMERFWRNGLLQQNGDRHKQQRRLIMPAFHKKRVDAYRDDIVAQTERALAGWQPGTQRDVLTDMKQLTLAVAVKTLLGLEPDEESERLRRLLEAWVETQFSIAAMVLPLNVPGLPYRRTVQMAAHLEGEVQPWIERKRHSGLDDGSALAMLIQARDEDGTRLTDAELIAQTGALFVAGYITTASALTWTLFLLAQHPAALADLVDELDSVLHGAAPTVEQLAVLALLDGVVKESMRLLPPFPFSLRVAHEPVMVGPYALPKGTQVLWSAAVTHRIPDLYPNPQKFQPERWRTISPSPYEYLPFSGGPRRCIGAEFALLELRLVLAVLLQRYRLALPPNHTVDRAGIVFSFPKGGLPMTVHAQDRRFSKTPVRGNIHALVDLN